MKRHRLLVPLLGIALLWIAFAGYVWITAGQLPERVATHFGANGQANGWMTRGGHVQFTLLMGAALPAFVMGLFALMSRFPGQALNVSHKEYWLAPERRAETLDFIQRQGIRFAGLFIAFLAAIHWSILAANRHTPAVLPGSHVAWIAGGFLVAAVVWVLVFVTHFLRKPA
jgi:uncharacterized membrane protein